MASDAKIESALQFAQEITRNRDQVSSDAIVAFKNDRYDNGNALEEVLNVVANTLANYVNHLAETEIDFPTVEAGKFSILN
ncbi:hypothetical protein KH5_05570 [Urechidicola sp. KH5]